MALECSRNRERFEFIAWCRKALGNLRVIPPGNGIMHQVNLAYLASVVTASGGDGDRLAYPDTLVGTDSHTPMVNGLGVLGCDVGGIEAEAVMLGRKLSLRARGRLRVHRASGATDQFDVLMRLDTAEEVTCYTHGGILPMLYRESLAAGRH